MTQSGSRPLFSVLIVSCLIVAVAFSGRHPVSATAPEKAAPYRPSVVIPAHFSAADRVLLQKAVRIATDRGPKNILRLRRRDLVGARALGVLRDGKTAMVFFKVTRKLPLFDFFIMEFKHTKAGWTNENIEYGLLAEINKLHGVHFLGSEKFAVAFAWSQSGITHYSAVSDNGCVPLRALKQGRFDPKRNCGTVFGKPRRRNLDIKDFDPRPRQREICFTKEGGINVSRETVRSQKGEGGQTQ